MAFAGGLGARITLPSSDQTSTAIALFQNPTRDSSWKSPATSTSAVEAEFKGLPLTRLGEVTEPAVLEIKTSTGTPRDPLRTRPAQKGLAGGALRTPLPRRGRVGAAGGGPALARVQLLNHQSNAATIVLTQCRIVDQCGLFTETPASQ